MTQMVLPVILAKIASFDPKDGFMDGLYFSKFSIHGLTQFLLALMITGYLIRVPQKSLPTKLLVVFFGGFLLTTLANFLLVSVYVPWRSLFGLSQAIGGAISLVALIQFAYWFPKNLHVKESKVALWLSICFSLSHGLLIDRSHLISSSAFLFSGLIMTVQVSWPVVVMVRKVLILADQAKVRGVWDRLRNPGNKEARALRAFAFLSCLWVILSAAVVLESLRYLSVETLLMTLVGVHLFFLFGFVLVYMNRAPEPSSLKVKFVGLFVVVLLLVMGDMGAFMLRDFEWRYHETCLAEVAQCRQAMIDEDLGAMPKDIKWVVRYRLNDKAEPQSLYRQGDFEETQFHEQYVGTVLTPQILTQMKQTPDVDPNVIRDRLTQQFTRADMVSVQLDYGFGGLISELNYAIYFFTIGDSLFEVHYSVSRYLEVVHSFAAKIMGFILGTSVFIVIIIPLFFKSGLDRPLRDLLAGVRDVNAGRLDVTVPVYVEDEIGYVAQSFNKMVGSVRDADERLKRYAQELEDRVEARTQDLTEKNTSLENALKELQVAQQRLILQEKMASLGELVAGVAHEINNPIGAVKSSADVSLRCVSKIASEVETQANLPALKKSQVFEQALMLLKDNAQVIQSASDRVATLVACLKNFSRVDEAEFQKVDLHEGLDSSLTLVRVAEHVSVVKTYGELPPVYCAAGQINQVFYNVLKNAAQAVGEGGEIHIETTVDGSSVCVSVRDNGKGIPESDLNHIFDFRFTQTKERVKMGSGLASAYDIVQKHGGNISISSEAGVGTEVQVVLPLVRKE